MSTAAYEWEAMPEAGALHECEGECEYEAGPHALHEAALDAARAALGSLGEAEWEGELEGEGELNPVRKVYPDAALEHLAHAAMNAESEAEAGEAFLPLIPMVASRLLPLAARALPAVARSLPRVMSAVSRVSPQLTRGVTRIAGRLFRNPQTRGLLRALPSIARRTVGTLVRQAARGAPVTPQVAVRTLARQAAGVLRSPPRVAGVVRRSRVLDGVYHRRVAPSLGLPTMVGGMPSAGVCARCAGQVAAPAVPMTAAPVVPMMTAAPAMPMVVGAAPPAARGCRCRAVCPCCGR